MSTTSTASRGSTTSIRGSMASMKKSVDTTQKQPATTTSKQNQAAKELQDLFARVSKYAGEYSNFDQILEERASLQRELERKKGDLAKKDNDIKFLEAAKKSQLNDLLDKYNEWESKKVKLQSQITSLKNELQTTESDCNSTKKELTTCKERLNQFDTSLTPLRELNIGIM
jgi:chromosome segregation ATPase